jgi:uncharacterized protein YyaL (SSP411 family)
MWNAYREKAWGFDEILPVTGTPRNNWGGLSLFMIEAMGTLHLMGYDKWYRDAEEFLEENLDFGKWTQVNVFETTIRLIGGLISAHEMRPNEKLLEKIKELGSKIKTAYAFKGGLPYSDLNLKTGKVDNQAKRLTTSEMYVSVELLKLADVTGDKEYAEISKKVENYMFNKLIKTTDKVLPHLYEPTTQEFGGDYTMGARSDSLYEYMYKSWVLDGKKDKTKRKVW